MNINSSELFNKIKNIQYYISLFFERMISIMIPRFLIISSMNKSIGNPIHENNNKLCSNVAYDNNIFL